MSRPVFTLSVHPIAALGDGRGQSQRLTVRVVRGLNPSGLGRVVAEFTSLDAQVSATFYDARFQGEVDGGIYDDGLGGMITLADGLVFLDALERRYHRSSTTSVERVNVPLP